MNKYWCDYNILINISPFFVVALVKKIYDWTFPWPFYIYFPLQHKCLGFRFCCSILFSFLCFMPYCWTFYLHLFPIHTDICVLIRCQKFVEQICHINFFSSHVCFCFSCFSLFQSRYSCKKKNLKQQNYKSLNLWSQHSWTFYVIYSRIKKDHEKIKTSFLNLIQCRMKHFSI